LLDLPRGLIYAEGAEAARFLTATGNPLSGREAAVIGPATLDWFAVFGWDDYSRLGFVRGRRPDVEEIARALRLGSEAANAERRRRGDTTLELMDWREKPRYDEATGRLEWAVETVESEGREVSDAFVYFLGGDGVLSVELVSNPREYAVHRAALDRVLATARFAPGRERRKGWPAAWLWSPAAAVVLTVGALMVRLRARREE
jgi:uncharacterized membrane-anchored protein